MDGKAMTRSANAVRRFEKLVCYAVGLRGWSLHLYYWEGVSGCYTRFEAMRILRL